MQYANSYNKVFSTHWKWSYSCLNEFVTQLEYKERKCQEMNKSKIYEYLLESSISFSEYPIYNIIIKVYKRV